MVCESAGGAHLDLTTTNESLTVPSPCHASVQAPRTRATRRHVSCTPRARLPLACVARGAARARASLEAKQSAPKGSERTGARHSRWLRAQPPCDGHASPGASAPATACFNVSNSVLLPLDLMAPRRARQPQLAGAVPRSRASHPALEQIDPGWTALFWAPRTVTVLVLGACCVHRLFAC